MFITTVKITVISVYNNVSPYFQYTYNLKKLRVLCFFVVDLTTSGELFLDGINRNL